MQHNSSDLSESHPLVEFDGVLVRGADMEPGDEAIATVVSRQLPHERGGVPFTAMCRVSADPADLRVAVERQPLASHCDQFTL